MILLDTHAFLWLCLEPRRLSRPATESISRETRSGGLAIASISLWEIATLIARGQLAVHGTPEAWISDLIETSGVAVKPITPAVATLSTQFPRGYPDDPADRLIGATARAERLPLVTRDRHIRASPLLRTVW